MMIIWNGGKRKEINTKRIVIIGAGTGGEVIADTLRWNVDYKVIGLVDDDPIKRYFNFCVIHNNIKKFPYEFDRSLYDAVIISIASDMKLRKEIFELYKSKGIKFINAIDKSAVIGGNVKIGEGNFIGANTYIGTSSIVGDNNWIAASVNIDHHNKVGNHNLFGPNFSSPGIVTIGNSNKFGANSSLNNYAVIGDNNIILNNVSVYKKVGNGQVIGEKVNIRKEVINGHQRNPKDG